MGYNIYNNEHIKQFWVGLMDGDGSIQVNHWRKKNLQYRLIIKLKNLPENVVMLNKIKINIGGNVRLTKKQDFVIWVMDDKKKIIETIKIFSNYPPLTSRLICSLKFLNDCLIHSDVDTYLNTRKFKYINISSLDVPFSNPSYFPSWLSGFIEAESCFSIRKKNNHSFGIGQNNNYNLLVNIRNFFGATNIIRTPYKDKKFFYLEIYKKDILLVIINHCETYPLKGAKYVSKLKLKEILV
jgi:hypothetical protein